MRLVRRLVLLVLLLAVIAGIALWYLPADFAWRHAGQARLGPTVGLQDLSGTVRHGRAGQLLVNGFPVGALDWTLDWRGLFRRQVGASWQLSGSAWQAQAGDTRLVGDAVEVRDLRAQLPALLLQPMLDIPALNFLGTVEIELASLRHRAGRIEQAQGQARWIDAGVTGQAQARFGPLRAQFGTGDDGRIVGTVEDEGGPLSVEGQFHLDGRSYRAEVILIARDPADPVAQALYYIGEALPGGGSLLIVEGELRQRPPADGQGSGGG
jgi:general secretion pathway protein N